MIDRAMSSAENIARARQPHNLATVSARLGRDFQLVQGPGGNSSVKDDGTLWVKASGFWLAEALDKAIFVPLSLPRAQALLAAGEGDDFASAVLPGSGLKASIETGLHALMPHRVVIHTHAFGSVLTAILRDGQDRAGDLLGTDFRWDWVPYHRPGGPLAEAIAQVIARSPIAPDVLLLANHGILVGADTAEQAEALLRAVENRLAFPLQPRLASQKDAPASISSSALFEFDPTTSRLAADATALRFLTEAPRFPDQVVFVGGAMPLREPSETLEEASARVRARSGIEPVALVEAGVGIYLRRDRTPAADTTVRALLDIALRLPEGAAFEGLSGKDIHALVNWDAEAYRQNLDNARKG